MKHHPDLLRVNLRRWERELKRLSETIGFRWGDARRCRSNKRKIERRRWLLEHIAAARVELGEAFALQNDQPRHKPAEFENQEGQQRVLFAGLDCLAGQRNLFETDGESEE